MVFVMLPFKPKPKFERVFKSIETAADRHKLKCTKGDSSSSPGVVSDYVMEEIRKASVCVADVSGNNLNVLIELGYAYAFDRPVILVSRDPPEAAPFFIRHLRFIQYDSPTSQQFIDKLDEAFASARVDLVKMMLVPESLTVSDSSPFVIAANPLPPRYLTPTGGTRQSFCGTSSDNVGIRGLIQSFGLIYGHNRVPELVHPADYDDQVCLDTRMHLYCIASSKANRWTRVMIEALNQKYSPRFEFRPDPNSQDLQNVLVMLTRDENIFVPEGFDPTRHHHDKDFGLIIRAPHPRFPGHLLLILAGRSSLGTQAACLAATDPRHIGRIREKLGVLNLDDHHAPFAAVVAIAADQKNSHKPDGDTLRVCEVFPLEQMTAQV